jgi:mRNA interferase MazF
MIELTAEQAEALTRAEQPPLAVNPSTQEEFVRVRKDRYEAMQKWVAALKRRWDDPADDDRPDPQAMNGGDVVEEDWPFSDRTGSKTRPAVVVQADFLNGLFDDTIFVQITGTRHGLPGTEVAIEPAVETASGLTEVCCASCTNVLTLDRSLVLRTVGVLSDAVLQQIEACLKTVLEIR